MMTRVQSDPKMWFLVISEGNKVLITTIPWACTLIKFRRYNKAMIGELVPLENLWQD